MKGFNEVLYNLCGVDDLSSPGEKDRQDLNGFAWSANTDLLVVTRLLRSS